MVDQIKKQYNSRKTTTVRTWYHESLIKLVCQRFLNKASQSPSAKNKYSFIPILRQYNINEHL
jgi:hypothetical protein